MTSLALASIPGMKLGEYQFVVELKSPTLSPQLLRTLEAEGDLYSRGKLNCLPSLSFVSSDGKFLDHQIADGFI
jgi:hypothetical protein